MYLSLVAVQLAALCCARSFGKWTINSEVVNIDGVGELPIEKESECWLWFACLCVN